MGRYSEVHQRFMQAFLSNPVQPDDLALKNLALVYREVEEREIYGDADENLKKAIDIINQHIMKYTNLQIRSGICEIKGSKYFVLVNTAICDWVKTVSPYSKYEQALFVKILDEIMKSDDRCASSVTCLNFASSISSSLTKGDANKAMQKFVNDGWFIEKKGFYHIAVRAALELEPVIQKIYEDFVTHCPLCKQMSFVGYRCVGCDAVGHNRCFKQYFNSASASPHCPACGIKWTDGRFAQGEASTSEQPSEKRKRTLRMP